MDVGSNLLRAIWIFNENNYLIKNNEQSFCRLKFVIWDLVVDFFYEHIYCINITARVLN